MARECNALKRNFPVPFPVVHGRCQPMELSLGLCATGQMSLSDWGLVNLTLRSQELLIFFSQNLLFVNSLNRYREIKKSSSPIVFYFYSKK